MKVSDDPFFIPHPSSLIPPFDPVVQRQRRLDDTQENGSSILPGITETTVCRCFGSTRPW
jgi:hypothetical protein